MPALLTRMSSPPSSLDGGRDGALPVAVVGDVEGDEPGRRAGLRDGVGGRAPCVLEDVADHHRRAGSARAAAIRRRARAHHR